MGIYKTLSREQTLNSMAKLILQSFELPLTLYMLYGLKAKFCVTYNSIYEVFNTVALFITM